MIRTQVQIAFEKQKLEQRLKNKRKTDYGDQSNVMGPQKLGM